MGEKNNKEPEKKLCKALVPKRRSIVLTLHFFEFQWKIGEIIQVSLFFL